MSGNLVRVLADRDRCIGAGQCVLAAPHVFDQSDHDGRVLILPQTDTAGPPQPKGLLGATLSPRPAGLLDTALSPRSEGPLNAALPPRSRGLLDITLAPDSQGPLDAALPPRSPGRSNATVPPDSEGPLVDEAIARAAVDLCPSRALSLARP